MAHETREMVNLAGERAGCLEDGGAQQMAGDEEGVACASRFDCLQGASAYTCFEDDCQSWSPFGGERERCGRLRLP